MAGDVFIVKSETQTPEAKHKNSTFRLFRVTLPKKELPSHQITTSRLGWRSACFLTGLNALFSKNSNKRYLVFDLSDSLCFVLVS